MSIPNYQHVVEELAAQYPAEWRAAHTGGPQTEAFIRRLAWVLHQRDTRIGLNGKRGNPDDISDDVVNVIGEGPGHDPRTGQPVTVIDVIVGAGGSNPQAAWNVINQPGPGAWVQPAPMGGEVPGPEPIPTPSPTCRFQPTDLGTVVAELAAVRAELSMLRADVNATKSAAEAARDRVIEVPTPAIDWPLYQGSVSLPGWAGGSRAIVLSPLEEG